MIKEQEDIAGIVSPRNDIEDVVLGIESAVPCGLRVNELLTNCLRHVFPGIEQERLTIALRRNRADGRNGFVLS